MNTVLKRNLWLLMASWTLYFTNHDLPAFLLVLFASLYLLIKIRRFHFWRVLAVYLLSLFTAFLLYEDSRLAYFFTHFLSFMVLVSFNVAMSFEYVQYLRSYRLRPYLYWALGFTAVSFLLAFLLPDDWYSLFGKASLYKVLFLMFGPYDLTFALTLLTRKIMIRLAHHSIIGVYEA